MAFTPGQLTTSQAEELNQLLRDVAKLKAMTATAPMTIERANGVPVISLKGQVPQTSDNEFDAQITARIADTSTQIPSGSDRYLYSWRKVRWKNATAPAPADPPNPSGTVPTMEVDPAGPVGIWNLRRNYTNAAVAPIAVGQVVRIKLMPGSATWYETDSIGGMSSFTFTYLATPSSGAPYGRWRTLRITARDMPMFAVIQDIINGQFSVPDVFQWSINDWPGSIP